MSKGKRHKIKPIQNVGSKRRNRRQGSEMLRRQYMDR